MASGTGRPSVGRSVIGSHRHSGKELKEQREVQGMPPIAQSAFTVVMLIATALVQLGMPKGQCLRLPPIASGNGGGTN
jgi:hypothetical protein